MATVTARAPSPKMRKAGAPTPTSASLINTNAEEYTLAERRAQRLSRMFGIAGQRAHLIASLAYEVCQ